ncbi:MAG TPA: hypothetical protein VFL91_20500 [Thermomicrobiales bacterium]|nr:hypothetical protein [Thermomicrobiales bacterium]
MQQRYGALRIVAVLARVVALLIGAGGLLVGIILMAGSIPLGVFGGPLVGIAGVFVILWGFATALNLYARADMIDVHLSIEQHTREAAVLIRLNSDERIARRERLLEDATLRWD